MYSSTSVVSLGSIELHQDDLIRSDSSDYGREKRQVDDVEPKSRERHRLRTQLQVKPVQKLTCFRLK
jgi:hypothetical protein